MEPPGTYNQKMYNKRIQKGEELGGFKLGSTVVLVFEAPKDSQGFKVDIGDKVKVGQPLYSI